MQENQPQREAVEPPRDAGAILAEVGLTPEALQGKSVLYFGSEPLVVEGVKITEFDMDYYIASAGEDMYEDLMDLVVVVDYPYVQDALGNEEREDVLVSAVEIAEGEVRIAKPVLDPKYSETPEDIEAVFEMALLYHPKEIEARARYDRTDESNPYLVIKRLY